MNPANLTLAGLLATSCATFRSPCPADYALGDWYLRPGDVTLRVRDAALLDPVLSAVEVYRLEFPYQVRIEFDPFAIPHEPGTVAFVEPYANWGTTHFWSDRRFAVEINANAPRQGEDWLQTVVSHELGHVFGLDHAECTDSVMNAHGFHSLPTPSDLDQIRKAYQ